MTRDKLIEGSTDSGQIGINRGYEPQYSNQLCFRLTLKQNA